MGDEVEDNDFIGDEIKILILRMMMLREKK